ncbi:hypothetical protein KFK09_023375 [Dendrobium nobile]|uniref:poly(A)-specific ribonuclease n=1 Tax=Dendrobium nobile TaxID=94219 RepID=A0A8T3ALE2_DENNO|nr:hypothetical protein KFK09_023375 [Dendrobium nobile]
MTSAPQMLYGDYAAAVDAVDSVEIREVWNFNLEEEFFLISSIVADYPFVAIDSEFPGVPLRPVISSPTSFTELNYQTLKTNVNFLKLIQVGLTFFDSSGRLPLVGSPPRPCIWQFNFREFNATSDFFAPDSIELLRRSGINFEKNHCLGVAANRFAELMIASGVVLNDTVQWITFHGCYDFGYLLKMLTCRNLPDSQEDFFHSLRLFFPNIYDIKHVTKICSNFYGGLNKLAWLLGVKRMGTCHQAGSDSLLTAATFTKLKSCFANGSLQRCAGVLYGLGAD